MILKREKMMTNNTPTAFGKSRVEYDWRRLPAIKQLFISNENDCFGVKSLLHFQIAWTFHTFILYIFQWLQTQAQTQDESIIRSKEYGP